MNFRKMITLSFFVMLFIALLALPTFAKDAIREEDSPYSLIVGDVFVTDANKADILGDGTAVFDSENNVLTIKNFSSEKMSTITVNSQTGYKSFFSVFYVGEEKLTVKIEGNCHFMSAVRVDHGEIQIKDATVTFSEYANAMLESEYGLITIQNSEILVENVEYIAPLSEDREGRRSAISAASIQIFDSKIVCDVKNPTMDSYHDAFLSADNDMVIENSKINVSAPFPVFQCALYAGNGILGMENVRVTIERQEIAIASISKIFSAIDCNIKISECKSAIAAAKISLQDCTLNGSTFSDAIAVQNETDADASVILDSKVKITNLSQKKYESVFGKAFWNSLEDEEKAEYKNDFDAFMRAHYQQMPYSQIQCGIILIDGTLGVENSKIILKGYDVGVYTKGQTYFKLKSGVRMNIKANDVAFLMLSTVSMSPFIESDTFRTFGKDVVNVKLPQQLVDGENQIFTFSSGKVEVGTLLSDASLASVVDAVDGAARHVRLYTAGAIPVWLIALLFFGGTIVVLVVLALILIAVLPNPKKVQKPGSENEEEIKTNEA